MIDVNELEPTNRRTPVKTIRTPADLAVHGAEPAFAEVRHVGRPNLGSMDRFIEHVDGIFRRGWVTNRGPKVRELEERIAGLLGVKHCVAMCNGTVALEIAIRALGFSGEVIVPSYSFIATAHALSWQEITPVFADIDPSTHNLDPVAVERMITPRTSGIVGVHLWGRPAPIEGLRAIADEHGLGLMFDAAHAFGCTDKGRKIGGFGDCEVFSFHATKYFNTFEGGAVATDDDDLAETMRLMQNFGFSGLDTVVHPGTNGKMNEICAAMGLVNLERLDDIAQTNHRNHLAYRDGLAGIDGVSLLTYDEAEQCNYQYAVVELNDRYPVSRDRLVEILNAENVRARRYFWPGCHRMQPYRSLQPHARLMLPRTEDVAARVVVLPTGEAMSVGDVETVCDIIRVASASSA
jgi:dTDP-4-amino-4,6-dideoxygalactose transaminase